MSDRIWTYVVSVHVKLAGRPGRPDFDDWVDIGLVRATCREDAYRQIGEGLDYTVETGIGGYMMIKDGPMICIVPSTEIEGSKELLQRCESQVQHLLRSGKYLPSCTNHPSALWSDKIAHKSGATT